jgi:hypothetical protein
MLAVAKCNRIKTLLDMFPILLKELDECRPPADRSPNSR